MRGLRLTFSQEGPISLNGDAVTDLECIQQNALVNIGTSKGSDAIFPDKGTDLFKAAVGGVIYDIQSAQHAANFAALDTVTFLRDHEYASQSQSTLETLQLNLRVIEVGRLQFQASMVFSNGVTSATQTSL